MVNTRVSLSKENVTLFSKPRSRRLKRVLSFKMLDMVPGFDALILL